MNTRNPRAYILFVIALAINAFGIAFITRALLGTSPITSITYVMSMFTSLTMGQWTIVLNLGFMVLELPFMRKADLKSDTVCYLLQIPTTLFFGSFIDVSMNALSWLQPEMYVLKIASLLLGCVILALGIALEVKANVAMAAGEYFVKAIARRLRTDFGYTKLGFDSSLVALSCIVSYAVMETIQGVREGTVVTAIIVGPIVHFISPWFKVFDRFLYPSGKTGRPAGQASLPVEDFHPGHRVITIAREFGSGGHLLGERLSKELGIRLYDKEFIHLAAQESGMDEAYIRKNEQSIPSFWLKSVYAQNKNTVEQSMAPDDVAVRGREQNRAGSRCQGRLRYRGTLRRFCAGRAAGLDPGVLLRRFGCRPPALRAGIRAACRQGRIGNQAGEPQADGALRILYGTEMGRPASLRLGGQYQSCLDRGSLPDDW